MASRFRTYILRGDDPVAQYNALATKDQYTFYLTINGYGWFGTVPLFGGGQVKTQFLVGGTLNSPQQEIMYICKDTSYTPAGGEAQTLNGMYYYDGSALVSYSDQIIAAYLAKIMVQDMGADGFTPDHATIPTTKAVKDMLDKFIGDSGVLTAKFFRMVKSHTLTQEDMDNAAISKPVDAAVGDIGLLFTADNDMADGGESYYFISLKGYIDVYTVESTDSILLTKDEDNLIKADLNIKADETSLLIDATDGAKGVYIKKASTIDDTNPDGTKLPTEKAVVDYITTAVLPAIEKAIADSLANVVTFEFDPADTP